MPPKKKSTERSEKIVTRRGARSTIASTSSLPPVTNISKAEVGAVVQSFIDNGVERLSVFPDGPGTFTVQPE